MVRHPVARGLEVPRGFGIDPIEELAEDPSSAAGGHLKMGPGSDGEGHGDAAVAEPPVLLESLSEEDVLPAGDQPNRRLDTVDGRRGVLASPVGVGGVVPDGDVPVPG